MTEATKKYKEQAEQAIRDKERLEYDLKRMQEAEKKRLEESKKRYSAIVYCTNCMEVNSVSIPAGVTITEGDCVTCRVRGTQRLVKKVNNV
jgi:hypothetical protein